MKEIKVYNKQGLQTFGATLQENEIDSWLELIGEAKGLPERWVRAKELMENGNPNEPEHWMWHSEYYEDNDVLQTEERTFEYVDYELNDLGHTIEVKKQRKETWVLLKADYTIEIIDLEKDYDYLLKECHTKRLQEYPSLSELADALYWKENGNESKYKEYIKKCDEVKKKYPLPIRSNT